MKYKIGDRVKVYGNMVGYSSKESYYLRGFKGTITGIVDLETEVIVKLDNIPGQAASNFEAEVHPKQVRKIKNEKFKPEYVYIVFNNKTKEIVHVFYNKVDMPHLYADEYVAEYKISE